MKKKKYEDMNEQELSQAKWDIDGRMALLRDEKRKLTEEQRAAGKAKELTEKLAALREEKMVIQGHQEKFAKPLPDGSHQIGAESVASGEALGRIGGN